MLGRAAAVAAPAGLAIWCLANIRVGTRTLLALLTAFFDPAGRFLGMDGVILLAFILGFPANELVLPVAMMAFGGGAALGAVTDAGTGAALAAAGWTVKTAACAMIFYGPSGTGKTTVANLIAAQTKRKLVKLNATTASSADIKEIYAQLDTFLAPEGVLLYLDEIQYFNKKQQQTLLEYIENGKVTLIASTTENPYFYVYNAILSRSTVFEFKSIDAEAALKAVRRAVRYLEQKNGVQTDPEPGTLEYIAGACGGDIRKAINAVELLFTASRAENGAVRMTLDDAKLISQRSAMGEVQVRKDLALVSDGGRPKIGYNRQGLIGDIEEFLGYGNTNDAVLIGAGKLGRALLGYSGFAEYGLNIVAAFDSNDALLGISNNQKPIMSGSGGGVFYCGEALAMLLRWR